MFKDLRGKLERRKNQITQQVATQEDVQRIVSGYLNRPIVAIYDPIESSLHIETGSKALASELLFQVAGLGASLRKEGIAVKKLIIR